MNNMSINTNTLAAYREQAKVALQDVAYLLNVDPTHLRKVEQGERPISVKIILTYHILFRAPLKDSCADLYAHLHAILLERSQKLITILDRKKSPKSSDRIEYLTRIVNSLNHEDYEQVN